MQFEFSTAGRIIFGAGRFREVGPLAKELGRRALVVTGRDTRRAEPLLKLLRGQGIDACIFSVPGEPSIEIVQHGVKLAKEEECDSAIGMGGGSALDAGKAIAALMTNPRDIFDFLEIVGRGKPLAKPSAPFIAIPTTAGTGSEVTRNAVLASPPHRVKVSLRSPLMLPRIALVDSELTHDLPPALTASTGLDALTQLVEPYLCLRANPMTDALCLEGIGRVARSLRVAVDKGKNASARADMALASLFGGIALSNAGLGAVHGLAGPIGGMFPAPHGAVCAALLPHVTEMNLRALRQRQFGDESERRYETVARILTGKSAASADDGVKWTRKLVADLHVPGLREHGVRREHFSDIVERAAKASSMKANPIVLTAEELGEILDAAI